MHRLQQILSVAVGAAIAVGCGAPKPTMTADEAYKALIKASSQTEEPAEKAALYENYLSQYPATEHTGPLAGAVAYYRGEAMEDPNGAVKVLDGLLAKVTDPETRYEIQLAEFPLAEKTGHDMDLDVIVAEYEEHHPLDFSEQLEVSELAAQHDLWDTAERHAASAATLATAEAYRADHPDEKLSDEELAANVAKRKVLAAADRGWALSNLGREPEAIATFEAAAPLSTTNYLGVPATELYSYWGRTALAMGDAERALELLGPTAVLGDDKDALNAFHEAYVTVSNNEKGFDNFLWTTRKALAKTIDDFELPDYQGQLHKLSDSHGKVVLLAFWFPT